MRASSGIGRLGGTAIFIPLFALEVLFVAANSTKILHGGWFPIMFAAGSILIFVTWKRGRSLVNQKMKRAVSSCNHS